jgi:hypothetical protein
MASRGVHVTIDTTAVRAVLGDAQARRVVEMYGEAFAGVARGFAAKATGAGAESIHGKVHEYQGVLESTVSWDRSHFYMYFREVGTWKLPAHPALKPALDVYAQF